VTGPTPLLDLFKRGEVERDVRLLAAQGALAPRAHEQLGILILLVNDPDPEIRASADATLNRIPQPVMSAFLARSDVPIGIREFFAGRNVFPTEPPSDADDPLIDVGPAIPDAIPADAIDDTDDDKRRLSVNQQLTSMSFTDKLKAAVKGTREMRAILVRDPSKMISASVLSSPKLTEQEVENFARMTNVSEDVLRTIGANRAWVKNYSVVVGLAKNPKTPLAMSLNFLSRLNDRDTQMLAMDRNVPEPLRVAARKKVSAATTKKE